MMMMTDEDEDEDEDEDDDGDDDDGDGDGDGCRGRRFRTEKRGSRSKGHMVQSGGSFVLTMLVRHRTPRKCEIRSLSDTNERISVMPQLL